MLFFYKKFKLLSQNFLAIVLLLLLFFKSIGDRREGGGVKGIKRVSRGGTWDIEFETTCGLPLARVGKEWEPPQSWQRCQPGLNHLTEHNTHAHNRRRKEVQNKKMLL